MRKGELSHFIGDILGQKPHLQAKDKPFNQDQVSIQLMINNDRQEAKGIVTPRSIQRGRRNERR